IYPAIKQCCEKRNSSQKCCRSISGTSEIMRITYINQKPIGQSPRSNPATFSGIMDEICDLFVALPDAKVKGLKKKHFSFNTKGGSCENCGGGGKVKVEMMFMSDAYMK
ncbi:MAG: ABC-ATPase UvrA, partial [Clostridiales bacterium]|nr:ABC-ATPase UvrA [Clostridiales bacterium]